MKKVDTYFGIGILIFSSIVYYITFSFPTNNIGSNVEVGAAFMPRLYSIALFALGVLMILSDNLKFSKSISPNFAGISVIIILAAISIIYWILLPTVGFIPLTFVYLIIFMSIIAKKFTYENVLYPIFITAAVYLVFNLLLKVPLPSGILG